MVGCRASSVPLSRLCGWLGRARIRARLLVGTGLVMAPLCKRGSQGRPNPLRSDSLSTRIRDRYSFANIEEALPLPDLIAIQRKSFDWFLQQGLKETFADISPIKDFTETLQLELEFDPDDEDLRPPPKFSVEECKEKDMTYSEIGRAHV